MKEEARQIFLQTIDADLGKRNAAESILMNLEKDLTFVMSLPHTCMKDSDVTLRRISAIYFKNTIIKQWKDDMYSEVRKYLIENILDLFLYGDDITRTAYNAILVHIFNTEKLNDLKGIFQKASVFMKSSDLNSIFTALNMYERIFDAEKIKYNLERVLKLTFGTAGKDILEKTYEFLECGNYRMVKIGMTVLAKSYCCYSIPDFLSSIGTFSYTFNLSLRILNLKGADENLLESRKWAAYFMYKACSKGIKKFYKNNELSEYITDMHRFQMIYATFLKIIQERSEHTADVELYAIDFFVLLTSSSEFFRYMELDLFYLISGYILPLYSLSDSEEDDIENDPDRYLREKYNYSANHLRNRLSILFCDIISKVKQEQETFQGIISYLVSVLGKYKENPTLDNTRPAYGSLFLLTKIKSTLLRKARSVVEYVVINHVIPYLCGNSLVMKSQACYFLSEIQEDLPINNLVFEALDSTHKLMKSTHKVLRVEGTLAMSFFLFNEMASEKFKELIPETVESILNLSNIYDFESLAILLDSIIGYYPDEISKYAPELVGSISRIALSHLLNENDEGENKLLVVSGFLRNMESLVLSLNQGSPTLRHSYVNSYDVISFILKEEKSDFYHEALDILNAYVFMIKEIEGSMWGLLQMVLNLPSDEIGIYPWEVANLIDNFVTYGKTSIMDANIIGSVYSLISNFCLCNEENLSDEEFIGGCRIIESIILNIGNEVLSKEPSRLSFFISVGMSGDNIDESSAAMVYALEVVMNCFILRPNETIQILREQKYFQTFFEKFFDQKNRFKRVHDKKICTLFVGTICRLQEGSLPELDLHSLNKVLVAIITSLPDAIKLRNQMKENEDTVTSSADSEEDEYLDASDDDFDAMDILEEDIYFESPLDHFEPFGYISSILSSPMAGSYGEKVVSIMTDQQKASISTVLNGERVVQKI
ncbi:nonsense-mediated mRNA decay protein 5 [Encephalitozoon romaleae SJ-2008]|uniref:Nonsense-mediated mRNA decay protein 5 n=1 Tax=Encephalitozoon romaleae (strain SJ-2008) TaxID=1178016 RepID=I7AGH1_ENCRO|nr:nonsense-mediated mRNA decay protein 5 [Encephalitozoon romaleae SJ-2008]AFN83865.1 nonsense-mediated mRNA decay protein 5 [Encephalitozoon romaleae SJ-2008]